jgi:hypothetical protein
VELAITIAAVVVLYLAWRWLFAPQVPPAGWDRAPWEAGGAEDESGGER